MDPAPRGYGNFNVARFENFVRIEGLVIVQGLLLVPGSSRWQLSFGCPMLPCLAGS